jgi:hypothetical protein
MKNWLIRTKNNHILGPVSKDKLLDLFSNGSIKSDDEVSSGNGYWFFIREKNLVDKFLLSNNEQPFNPVQEAENVLTAPVITEVELEDCDELSLLDNDGDELLPTQEDLSYPDLGEMQDSSIEEVTPEAKISDEDLEYPEMGSMDASEPDNIVDFQEANAEDKTEINPVDSAELNAEVNPELNPESDVEDFTSEQQQHFESLSPEKENIDIVAPVHADDKRNRNQFIPPELPSKVARRSIFTVNILLSLIIVFLIFLAAAIYFRGSILNAISHTNSFNLIDSANAQEGLFVQKKNSGAQKSLKIVTSL